MKRVACEERLKEQALFRRKGKRGDLIEIFRERYLGKEKWEDSSWI